MRYIGVVFTFVLGLTVPASAATNPVADTVSAKPANAESIVPGNLGARVGGCPADMSLPPGQEPNVAAAREALSEGRFLLAMAHLKPLADTDKTAAGLYGNLLVKGAACVPADKVKGVAYLKRSAAAGDGQSAFQLGVYYEQGIVLPQNDREAMRLYTQAAEAGNTYALMNLANMYLGGRGTDRDLHQYLIWTAKAAEVGRPLGLAGIASAYMAGTVLPKDLKKAYFWSCAASDRLASAEPQVSRFVTHQKAEIGLQLSVNEAKKIAEKAKAWVPGPGSLAKVLKQEIKPPLAAAAP